MARAHTHNYSFPLLFFLPVLNSPFVYLFSPLPFFLLLLMDFLVVVANNDIEKARQYIQSGIDVNSPILWNAKNTHSPVLPTDASNRPELREQIQSSKEYHSRPLNIAVIGGHADMVRLLLSAGADINLKDGRGR